jgi:hypothetical protein
MNATDLHDAEIAEFLSAVRAALDDLPDGVIDELADGLAADLAETRAERGEPLVRVVGSPQAYATELRAAAGLPPRTEPPREAPRPLGQRIADAVRPLTEVPVVRPVWRLLVELRPAWWVLRAYIAVGLLLELAVEEPLRHFPVLTAGHGVGGVLTAVLLVAAATAGSVWLGRRSPTGVLRAAVIAANLYLIYVGVSLLLGGAPAQVVYPAVDEPPPMFDVDGDLEP